MWDFTTMTVRDLGDEMCRIADGPEPEARAREFLEAYRAVNEHADANLGYLTGYYSRERADGLLKLFGVQHPIFGDRMPTSPGSALIEGQMAAKVMRTKLEGRR
jgi:hypothetical protein